MDVPFYAAFVVVSVIVVCCFSALKNANNEDDDNSEGKGTRSSNTGTSHTVFTSEELVGS